MTPMCAKPRAPPLPRASDTVTGTGDVWTASCCMGGGFTLARPEQKPRLLAPRPPDFGCGRPEVPFSSPHRLGHPLADTRRPRCDDTPHIVRPFFARAAPILAASALALASLCAVAALMTGPAYRMGWWPLALTFQVMQ